MSASKIDYKVVAIQAAVTATVFAVVNGMFNSGKKGLGHPVALLASMPLQRQAQFADAITVANVNNVDWLKKQLDSVDVDNPDFYNNANANSIGNCAFLVLHTNNNEVRAKCLKILDNLKKFAQ